MIELPLALAAFIAGFLTFLAPCTLPLIPGYLAFISGASLKDLADPEKKKSAKRQIIVNGIFYVLGFSIVFIVLGTLISFLGGAFVSARIWLSRIGGIFVILFGLFMMGLLKLPFLRREAHLKTPKVFEKGKPTNSFILGFTFALGWTPCIGPVLGSILLLASTSNTILQGSLLLAIFSAGLAIPFVLIAFGIGSASKFIQKISRYLNIVSVIGGLFLVALGILLLTNNMALLISYGYQIFDFINYEKLLNFL